ncbi:hypothetical protein [Vibrio coralliirubri]|uniref:hypothetical protein n=1 Tax=Vibrio coralliirubri TaxID=1516159 RepID=UPI0013C42DB9|nr:hypothetical protein [Vibrio coralliirubri]
MKNHEPDVDETLNAAEQAVKNGKLGSSVRLLIVSLRQILERQKLAVKNRSKGA